MRLILRLLNEARQESLLNSRSAMSSVFQRPAGEAATAEDKGLEFAEALEARKNERSTLTYSAKFMLGVQGPRKV